MSRKPSQKHKKTRYGIGGGSASPSPIPPSVPHPAPTANAEAVFVFKSYFSFVLMLLLVFFGFREGFKDISFDFEDYYARILVPVSPGWCVCRQLSTVLGLCVSWVVDNYAHRVTWVAFVSTITYCFGLMCFSGSRVVFLSTITHIVSLGWCLSTVTCYFRFMCFWGGVSVDNYTLTLVSEPLGWCLCRHLHT